MFCENGCKRHYCFWCKSIIVADGKKFKDDGRATHEHVLDCKKAPDKSKILTDTVLFPVPDPWDDDFDLSDFMHAFIKIQKLEILALRIQNGLCICICGVYTSCSSPCVFQAGPLNKSKRSCYTQAFKSCLLICATRKPNTGKNLKTNQQF